VLELASLNSDTAISALSFLRFCASRVSSEFETSQNFLLGILQFGIALPYE
jgi:hypothetical protein